MKSISQLHHLLILSQQSETYRLLIDQEKLPGLSIEAFEVPEQARERSNLFDIVFGEPSLVSQLLNQLPNLKWLQSSWAGVEPLIHAKKKHEYILTNIRNVYGPMVSEYVFGYMLMIERKMLPRWQSQLREEWDDQPYGKLKGKLFGLLGVGTIGAHLAFTAKHFGMRVYGYTRKSESCLEVDKYFHEGSEREFAGDLDFLVCCLPGTVATKEMVDTRFLAQLPKKAWLVNVGRGSTVDELALVNALKAGNLAGAVLDVFSEEPLPRGHPLWSTPNTFITSHTAARNNPIEIAQIFIDNYKRFIRGETLINLVDYELGY
jgi:phosphoglycerate dehydrogenase-like enzyme